MHITGEGQALVRRMQPHMERAQERLISPLSPAEQGMFNELIGKIIQANNDASRAPIAIDF